MDAAAKSEQAAITARLRREALLFAVLLVAVNVAVLLLRRHTDLDNAPQFRRLFDIASDSVLCAVFSYRFRAVEPRHTWRAFGWMLLGTAGGGVAYQTLRLLDQSLPGLLSVGALALAATAAGVGYAVGREQRRGGAG